MSLTPTYRPGRELLVTELAGSSFALAEIRVIGSRGNCRSILRYSIGLRAPNIEQKVVDVRKVAELRGITEGMPYRTRERLHHIAEAVLQAMATGADAITAMANVGDPLEDDERLPSLALDGAAPPAGGYERWTFGHASRVRPPQSSPAL